MTDTKELLKQAAGKSFGPVAFESDGKDLSATFLDDEVRVGVDGEAVLVESEASAPWPKVDGADAAEVQRRVESALDSLTLSRPEIVLFETKPKSDTLLARTWLEPSGARVGDLAAAVRVSHLLGRMAAEAVQQVERDLRSIQAFEEARKSLEEDPVPSEPDEAPATSPDPAAQTPAASSWQTPEPEEAEAVWCYVEQPTDLFGLENTSQVAGQAVPGKWYLRRTEANGWVHLRDPESGLEGWVAAQAVRKQPAQPGRPS